MNTTFITGILAIAGLIAAAPVLGAWAQEDSMVDEDAMMDSMMADDAMMSVTGPVQIGALIPFTGDLSFAGDDIQAATELAVSDFNAYLAEQGATWWIELVAEDTNTNAVVSLEKAQTLHARGISILLGPAGSANVQNVKSYADEFDMLVVSCCSTSPSLSIAGDSVYRLVPDDENQGAAVGKLLASDGIQGLVTTWRGDAYGDGLNDAVVKSFQEYGGEVLGVGYFPGTRNFALEVDSMAGHVQTLVDKYGADKVAVFMTSFEEALGIIQEASLREDLGNIRWYGSEAVAGVTYLLDDPIASEFVNSVNFTSLQVLISPGQQSDRIDELLTEELGAAPISFVHPAYDAVWIVGKAIMEANSSEAADVKKVLASVADGHTGAMASAELNEAGDLVLANYQIWKIVDNAWVKSGVYAAEKNILTAAEQPVGEVEVGSLYPLTGRQDATGYHTRDASQLGADHFNAFLDSINAGWKLTLVSEDTATNPNVALEKATTLHSRDIDIIIGPRISSTTTQVKTYADINDMMLISCCSTAPRLAIPNDSVFRLVPDDFNQAAAVGKLLESEGIEFVIPIWLGDTYGDGLRDATKANFESRGYAFDEGIRFDPEAKEFGSEVSILNDLVQDATETYGSDKVAVFLIAFGQSILILQNAGDYDALDDVSWFIAETLTKKSDVLNDPKTRDFVTRPNVGYTGVQVAESGNDIHRAVESYFIETIGEIPITLVYHAYDAAWLVGLSILQSGSTDAATIKSVFPEVASQYVGAIGSTTLNEAGDLDKADYAIWSIVDGEWTAIGRYSHLDDSIVNTGADAAPGSG